MLAKGSLLVLPGHQDPRSTGWKSTLSGFAMRTDGRAPGNHASLRTAAQVEQENGEEVGYGSKESVGWFLCVHLYLVDAFRTLYRPHGSHNKTSISRHQLGQRYSLYTQQAAASYCRRHTANDNDHVPLSMAPTNRNDTVNIVAPSGICWLQTTLQWTQYYNEKVWRIAFSRGKKL